MLPEVAPDEPGKGQRDEQRAGDGIELPALRGDLARMSLQHQTKAADDKSYALDCHAEFYLVRALIVIATASCLSCPRSGTASR